MRDLLFHLIPRGTRLLGRGIFPQFLWKTTRES
jgi:hypothetical protein